MTEELKLYKDARGFLYELLRRDNPNFTQFGQVYIIGDTKRGIIRAWHRHFRMDEWFCCVNGEAIFVLHDPEVGQFQEHHMIGDKPSLLYVPRNVFHGHQAFTDNVIIVAVCTEPYYQDKLDEERVPLDHFPGYRWKDIAP